VEIGGTGADISSTREMGRLLPDGKTGEKGMISEQISAKSSVGGRRAVSSCRMLGARGKARAAGMRASSRAELVLEEGAAALCPGPIPSRAAAPVSLAFGAVVNSREPILPWLGMGRHPATPLPCVGVRGLELAGWGNKKRRAVEMCSALEM
jgi:hypothetical protein